ncbi:MAG: hypothetical protein II993_01475 [Anaerotignum sp.]|nr:hypothetical protein [Anaerotignum sp.]
MSKEKEQIIKTLKLYSGNRKLTAKALGISSSTLWRKIKKYELEDEIS